MTFILSRMEAIPVKSLIVTQGPSSSVPNSVSLLWQMVSEQQVVSKSYVLCLAVFPSLAVMSQTNLSLAGNLFYNVVPWTQ